MQWFSSVFAFLAGALVTVQAGSNSQLKESFGAPMPALLVNYVLGFAVMLAYALVAREPWPAFGKVAGAPWWAWAGGLSGAAYRVAAILHGKRCFMALMVVA